jgi:hypothetical protein
MLHIITQYKENVPTFEVLSHIKITHFYLSWYLGLTLITISISMNLIKYVQFYKVMKVFKSHPHVWFYGFNSIF